MVSVSINYLLTSDSIGGSPPASSTKTLKSGFSLKRPATTEPDVPAPTMIKSNVSAIENNGWKNLLLGFQFVSVKMISKS